MNEDSSNWATRLQKCLARWEVNLPPGGLDNFEVYLDELTRWNEKVNLNADELSDKELLNIINKYL